MTEYRPNDHRPAGPPIGRAFLMLLSLAIAPSAAHAQARTSDGVAGIEAFNRALEAATKAMDNAAAVALWEEDGVSLLPSTRPIIGKAAIAQFFDAVTKGMPGAKMASFTLRCGDIQVSGPFGSEWCTEHQVVTFPAGQPPFDGWGKMLLVLHRDGDGKWRLLREMWNQAIPDSSVKSPQGGKP